MSGDNSAGIGSTVAGAAAAKANAQGRSNQRYGNMDQLLARERQIQTETPWAVTPFTREISKPDISANAYKANRTGGMSADQYKALTNAGFKFTDNGQFQTNRSGGDSKGLMKALGFAPDSPEGRQAMRGVAALLERGMSLKDIQNQDPKRLMALGG
jgi:hypothetical protein